MKRYYPFLLVIVIAACTPGPQEPAVLEPVAPATEATTTEAVEAPVTAAELPEEPAVVVTPADPSGLPEVPPLTASVPEAPSATETEATETETSTETETTETETAETETTETSTAESAGGDAEAEATTPRLAPQGTISISADNQSFFTNEDDQLNPVTVAAGRMFYLKLEFSDPDGITGAEVQLRNSAAAGALPTGPFEINSSNCDAQLASAPTELTCTLALTIAPGTQNIAEAGETAYAFRPSVTDALGNNELSFSWGYLIVGP